MSKDNNSQLSILHSPLIRPGYKQTEVGVIPEVWEISTIGREFDVQLGKMLDAEKNVGELKPYLGNSHVQWGSIDVSNLPLMRMRQDDIQRFQLRKGDLLACPPCQNSCRLDRKLNQGATRKRDGTIRRSVQEQSGGTDVAAGEREDE